MSKPKRTRARKIVRAVLRTIAIAAVWTVPFVLLLLGVYFVSTIILGTAGTTTSIANEARVTLLATIVVATILMLLYLLIRRWRSIFWRTTRWLLVPAIILVFCIGTIGSSIEYVRQTDSHASCDLPSALNTATGGAVYPIATDKGIGTAFAVNGEGLLVTASHVIENAERVYVNFVTGEVPATVVRDVPDYDLALLKIDQPTPHFLPFSDTYKVADPVYAVGWPGNTFTAGQASISTGVVSRILATEDLKLTSQETPTDMQLVQTDAAINPGNSGGPLIGACGVVGVVSAISDSSGLHGYFGVVSEQGIGYAVSAQTVQKILEI